MGKVDQDEEKTNDEEYRANRTLEGMVRREAESRVGTKRGKEMVREKCATPFVEFMQCKRFHHHPTALYNPSP